MAGSTTAKGNRPPVAASNRPDPSAVAATKKRAAAQNAQAKAAYNRGKAKPRAQRTASGALRSPSAADPNSPANQSFYTPPVADPQAAQDAALEEQGAADAAAAQRPTRAPMRFGSASLSSAVLGGLAFAILINFLQGGREQVRGWFAAKFLNRPYAKGTR